MADTELERLRLNFADLKQTKRNTEERLRSAIKALQFYADSRRYRGSNQSPIENDPYAKPDSVYMQDVLRDGGEIARKGLGDAVGNSGDSGK